MGKIIKPNIIPQNGWVTLCGFCGEQVGNKTKLCKDCKRKEQRQATYEANKEALEHNRKLGYCTNEVVLVRPI